jgi:hypothetical protein
MGSLTNFLMQGVAAFMLVVDPQGSLLTSKKPYINKT